MTHKTFTEVVTAAIAAHIAALEVVNTEALNTTNIK